MVTAGLMCAPEMCPVAKIAAITASPKLSPIPSVPDAPAGDVVDHHGARAGEDEQEGAERLGHVGPRVSRCRQPVEHRQTLVRGG